MNQEAPPTYREATHTLPLLVPRPRLGRPPLTAGTGSGRGAGRGAGRGSRGASRGSRGRGTRGGAAGDITIIGIYKLNLIQAHYYKIS